MRRKTTEIDHLNGEITLLARQQSLAAPVNQAITNLVKEAEKAGQGPPNLTPDELLAAASDA